MKKYLLIIIFFVTACVSVNKQITNCGKFEIEIKEKLYNNPLFINALKKQIHSKLNLVTNKNSTNVCKIVLKTRVEILDFDTDNSDITNRENITMYVNYDIFINDIFKYNDKTTIFYGKNILQQRYSDYKKSASIEENIIEYIANEAYKSILINMQK